MILGHQKQWQYLKKLAELDKLAHAYLFCGQEKLGKKTIAVEFAKWLFKEDVIKRQHPDFIFIEPPTKNLVEGKPLVDELRSSSPFANARVVDELRSSSPFANARVKKEIQISQIRECIWRLSLKPSVAPFKIALIDEAHCLNQEAQNSLLKTLEEPRGQTILFLVTEYPERLFPTIISRCQILKFYSVPKEEIERYLVDELRSSSRRRDGRRNLFLRPSSATESRLRDEGGKESEALFDFATAQLIKQIVEISAGRPGWAIDFMSDPQKLKTQKTVISDIIKMSNSDLAFRFQYAKNLTKEFQNLKDTLDIWLRHFRKVLISSINGTSSPTEALAEVKKRTEFSSPFTAARVGDEPKDSSLPVAKARVRNIIKLIQETNFLISTTNVNPRLALEILMMEL